MFGFRFDKKTLFLLLFCLPSFLIAQTNKPKKTVKTTPKTQSSQTRKASKQGKKHDNATTEKTRILFIVDCSYNMYEKWQSDSKIKITQTLISNIVDSLADFDEVECALRVFGSEKDLSSQDCEDTRLVVPFYRMNSDALKAKLKALVPKGSAVVAGSLEQAKEDFPAEKSTRNIVIMIVDNIDRCGLNIDEVSLSKQKEGAFLKPFIIGINRGMKDFYKNCGLYYEANNEVEFTRIINDVVRQSIHNTTVQVDLLDSYKQVTETNVPISFEDSQSKHTRYSFIHTFNSKGVSDSVSIDPLCDYDVTVHTIPPVTQKNVKIFSGTHNHISLDAAQGSLIVRYVSSKNELNVKPCPILVKQTGKDDYINVQTLNKKEKYLVGKYDLKVLSLPPLQIDSVAIGQSSLTTVEIPMAGVLFVDKGKSGVSGSLFVKKDDRLVWVVNLDENKIKERIELLPGEYALVVRDKDANKTKDSLTQDIKIESNKPTNVSLFVKKEKEIKK